MANRINRNTATAEQIGIHDAGVKERARAYQSKWRKENAHHHNALQRERRKNNPLRTLAHEVKYRSENAELLRQRSRDYAMKNPEKVKDRFKKYYEGSKAMRHEEWAYKDALRRGCEIGDRSLIIPMYEFAVEAQRSTGIRWSVDHIIPLALGGPHSAENMQPMELNLNHQKSGNPFWISDSEKYKDWRSVPMSIWPAKLKNIFNIITEFNKMDYRLILMSA